ncbi:hypothetical protein CANARDRAFT_197904 [[Candida] arabinofermentans NRRL YB-2248]|uniref:Autophagy-related protein 16 domain-containing protein n=1 Tax=[Candida] arabinofermentans NRRL YB-2248 TaxID=983967 RepID=A0A1E4T1X1_9ASCO|nr:hypothetical protein CANARDRAFT_197904 [[Candida] arabinofermentans NRRL YB-2248]
MSTSTWKTEILNRLIERDNLSKSSAGIYKSFDSLNAKIVRLREEIDRLHQDNTKLELSNALGERDILKQELESKNLQIEAYKAKNNSQLSEIRTYEKNLALLTEGYKTLQNRLKRLQEETKVKNQNIEIVNDDLLSLQIENNLLNVKVAKLTAENNELVERWMAKVSEDAQVLNDANEVLELSRKSMSPSEG